MNNIYISSLLCATYMALCNCTAIAGGMASSPSAWESDRKPNVLIILADDLGAMDVGFDNQDTFYETPHLDSLACEAIRFSEAYAANPVCSPTRYSVQTGKHPTKAGLTTWLPWSNDQRHERFLSAELTMEMALSETTIAERLKKLGYQTAFVGKWHLGKGEAFRPDKQGYDRNIGGWGKGAPSSYFSPYNNPCLSDGPDGEFITERLTEETIKLLEEYSANEKPFFIMHSFYQVHTPLQAPKYLVDKYEGKLKLKKIDRAGVFKIEEQFHESTEPRLVRQNQSHAVYAAMVESMDTAVGKILAKLSELNLDKNTLIIFTSDNGGLSSSEGSPTSNVPGRGGKGWLYEGGIRVPMLMKWPTKYPVPAVVDVPVTSIDIVPTVMDAVGVEPEDADQLDGISLIQVADKGRSEPRSLFWHYPHYSNQGGFPGACVRSQQWKLLENFEDGRVELYDLERDPRESHDLSDEFPQITRKLREELHDWYADSNAKFLRRKDDGPSPWHP